MKKIFKPILVCAAVFGILATFNVAEAQTAAVSCVGTPPATPQINLTFPSYPTSNPPNVYSIFLMPGHSFVANTTSLSYTYSGAAYGASQAFQIEATDQALTYGDAFPLGPVTATCNATINVVETVSGGTWTINPEGKTASSNTMRPSSSGSSYTLTSNSVPSGYTLQSITNTQNSSATLTLFPGATETFTITYTAIPAQNPTPTLTATPGACGSPTTAIGLSWGAAGANSYTVRRDGVNIYIGGATSLNDTGRTPGATYTYSVTASFPSGSPVTTTSSNVSATAPSTCAGPAVTLSASPTSVASGGASTLTWTSTNTTSCSASASPANGNWTGSKSPVSGGSQSTGALTSSTTFTLTCTGPGGSANASATVTVTSNPPPTVTLSASPTSVASGGASTLSWSSTNATSCSASGGWTGSKTTSGSQSTGALSVTTSYTLTCTGPGGSANASATVTVSATNSSTTITTTPGACGTASITVSWSAPGATSFSVLRNFTSPAIYTGANTSLTDTGLTPGGSYNYAVTSTFPSGPQTGANRTDTAPSNCVPPTAPTTVSATTGSCGAQINVSWSAVSGATSYEVLRSTTSGGTYTVIANGITTTSYTDASSLTSGVTYYYKVRAVNSGGSSANSTSTGSAAASAVCAVNPVPTLTATPGACGSPTTSIALSWSAAGATSYNVLRDGVYIAAGVGYTSMNDTGRTPGQTYTYRVAANFPSGSPAQTVTPAPGVSAVAPSACATINASSNLAGTTWTITGATPSSGSYPSQSHSVSPVAGGTSYTLVPSTVSGYTSSVSNTVTGSSATATVFPGNTVTFTVTYTNSVPATPVLTATTGPCGGYINLSWTSASGATSYELRRSGSIIAYNGPALSYSDLRPSLNTTYNYDIRATNVSGSSAWSTPVTPGTSSGACAAAFNYSLSATDVSITQGQSGQTTVTKTLITGTAETVNLTATGMPAGVTLTYPSQGSMPPNPGYVNFTVPAGTPTGNSTVTVTGVSVPSGITKTDTLVLTINAAAAPSVTVSPNPASPKVNQTVIWNAIASPLPCTYAWSGDVPTPAPTTSSFGIVYQTTGTKNVQVVATCGGINGNGSGSVYVGVDPTFQEF